MIKANRKWMTWCGIATCAGMGIGLGAMPAMASLSPGETEAIVHGQAAFEHRSTMVPMVICEDGSPCARPSSYWVLVLHSNGARYELQQPLAVGADRAPTQVELAGIHLRPGSEVELDGLVEKVSSDYSIVTQVKKLELVHPMADAQAEMRAETALFPTTVAEGWECRSTEQERDAVVVQIWYGANPDGIRMQVSATPPSTPGHIAQASIATFDQVSLFREPKSAYFTATSAHQSAWLRIKNDEQLFVLPADLRVADEQSELPIAGRDIELNCQKLISH